jgi:uncharacterized membrane protein
MKGDKYMEREKPDNFNHRISLIMAIFMAVFALVISVAIVATLELSHKTMVLGPGFYPLILSVGMLIFSLYLIYQLLSGRDAGAVMKQAIDRLAVRRSLSLFLLAVISVVTIPLLGFWGSMFLFSFVHLSFLEPKKQSLMRRLIYSVAIPTCVYYLFKALTISLPTPFWL